MNDDYQLVLSDAIILEARTAVAKFGQRYVAHFDVLLSACNYEQVAPANPEEIELNRFQIRDPKDIHVAISAAFAQVNCLITHDKDLTENDLLKQQVTVILPAVFLRDYMGWNSENLEVIRKRMWKETGFEE